MRWKRKFYKTGDYRIKKKFLFFPLCLEKEYRWLEIVEIVQKYYANDISYRYGWYNIAFYDQNDERWKNIEKN